MLPFLKPLRLHHLRKVAVGGSAGASGGAIPKGVPIVAKGTLRKEGLVWQKG